MLTETCLDSSFLFSTEEDKTQEEDKNCNNEENQDYSSDST